MAEQRPQAPANAFDPYRIMRQAGAGAIMAVPDIAGLAGALGWRSAAEWHHDAEEGVNEALGVTSPQYNENFPEFVARQAGAAAVGLPARALGATGRVLSAPGAMRVLEAVTPLTLPLTLRNFGINLVAGTAIGSGAQALTQVEQAARLAERQPQYEVLHTEADATQPTQPQYEVLHTEGAPAQVDAPAATQGAAPAYEVLHSEPPAERNRTWQGSLASALPYVAGGLMGASGIAALRQLRAANRADTASTGGLVEPGLTFNPEVAPLTTSETIAQRAISDTAATDRALREGVAAGNIPEAEALDVRGRIATSLQESAKNDRVSEFLRTGNDGFTATPHHSWEGIELEYSALRQLDPARSTLFNDALVAGTELNARDVNLRNGNFMPGSRTEPARRMLHDMETSDLQAITARAAADPQVARIMQMYRENMNSNLELMVASGLKSRDDVTRMARDNPDYVHTLYAEDRAIRDRSEMAVLTTGKTNNSPLSARTYGHESGSLRAQDPITAGREASRKVMALALENDARRAFAEAIMKHVRARPASAATPSLVRGIKTRVKDKTPAGWVPVQYSVNGKVYALEVAPPIAELMQSYPRATMPFVSGLTRIFRNMTTGPIAAAFGIVQAPASALMATAAISVNRIKGTRAGLLDAGLQRATGGRVGLRGDPTFALNSAYAVLADLGAEGSRVFADALRRNKIANSGAYGGIVKVIGRAAADRAFTAAQRAYDTSILAQSRKEGSAGIGISRDPAASSDLSVTEMALTPEFAALAQARNNRGGMDAVAAHAERLGARLTPTDVRRTWRLFATTLDIVSGAATSAYLRQNQGRLGSQQALHGTARRLAGDPATMGSSTGMQAIYSAIPYSNVTVQSISAYGRAIREHPAAAVGGIAMAVMIPQMTQLASAIIADEYNIANGQPPEHVMGLLSIAAAGQSTDIGISIPGVPFTNRMRIVPDLTYAPLSAAMGTLALYLLGANTDRFWTPQMKAIRDNFTAFMTDRTHSGVTAGLRNMGALVSPPPLMDYYGQAALGVDLGNAMDLTGPRVGIPRDRGAPGYTETARWNSPVPKFISDILETIGGATGQAVLNIANTTLLANRAPNSDPLRAGVEQYTLNSAGTMRLAPPMLQPERQLAQADAVGDALRPKENTLNTLVQGIGDLRRPGTVGSGQNVIVPDGVGRPAPHPELQNIIAMSTAVYQRLAPLRETRTRLQQELTSIDSTPEKQNNPIDTRTLRNAKVQEIRNINRAMYSMISGLETQLSRSTRRVVRFDALDPQRGIEQFRRLAAPTTPERQ